MDHLKPTVRKSSISSGSHMKNMTSLSLNWRVDLCLKSSSFFTAPVRAHSSLEEKLFRVLRLLGNERWTSCNDNFLLSLFSTLQIFKYSLLSYNTLPCLSKLILQKNIINTFWQSLISLVLAKQAVAFKLNAFHVLQDQRIAYQGNILFGRQRQAVYLNQNLILKYKLKYIFKQGHFFKLKTHVSSFPCHL